VALVAAVTRPTAGLLAALPSVLGTAAGVAALTLLTRRGDALVPASSDGEPARRSFLAAAGATGVAAAVAAGGGQVVGRRARSVAGERAGLALPPPVDEMAPVPAGVDPAVEGLTPYRTPNETFYRVDTALSVPNVPASSWSLRVHGMVEREVEIDFAELLDAGLVERMVTLTCVSNEVGGELAGNAVWLGLPVRELLRRAGPLPDADMVLSTSADGFTASTPLDTLTDDRDALLAVAMNGEPLPPEHGYPVRMVVPGLYGYVSATKWVVDLEVTRFDRVTAYWTDRGWSARGPVKTASRIDVPAGFARVSGRVPVAGVAWAQGRGIDAVEVQVDDGPWRAARLAPVVSADTWRQWVWEWDTAGVPAGNHRLTVRATDSTGETQTSERVPPIPDGATGWHSVSVRVE
jgi:DMSO/TMAO reductase YedYZ molybdopterin-dependent catalytic subunit